MLTYLRLAMCFPLLNLSWRWEHALGPRVNLPICDLRCVFRSWNWVYGESMPYGTLTYLRLAICLPFMNLNWRWEHAHLIGNRNPTTCIEARLLFGFLVNIFGVPKLNVIRTQCRRAQLARTPPQMPSAMQTKGRIENGIYSESTFTL